MSEDTLDGGPAHAEPGEGQDPLDGTDYVKVKFVGMAYDSLSDRPDIGDELVFTVRARCRGNGTEEMKSGAIREVAKFEVQSVLLAPATDE